MASGTFTVTGKAGAGVTVTAQVFTNIASFSVQIAGPNGEAVGMLTMTDTGGKVTQIAISAATTFTVTISSGSYTVTIS